MICPSCNRDLPEQPGLTFCPYCGGKIIPETLKSCPWEDRERLGLIASLISTLKESLTRPSDFYRKMPVYGGLGSPLLYAIICGTLGIMFAIIWQILFGSIFELMAQPPGIKEVYGPRALLALAILSPILVIIIIFISSSILHICLIVLGGNKKGFEATFRVVSYANGAQIFSAIPLCGGLIGIIWMIVIEIIGLKEAHGISGGKAALSVFLPLIFCCGIGLILALMIPFFIASLGSISSMKGVPI